MNRKSQYKDMEKWRKACNRQRKRYYAKTALYPPRKWTADEESMILDSKLSDHQLSPILHRSVEAIQLKRCKLRKLLEASD